MNGRNATAGLQLGRQRLAKAGTQHSASLHRHLAGNQVDLACALFLFLSSLALYAVTAVPGPFDGDYGEFQYMPRLLGLPHPTGYPIYLLLGWAWSWLPLGTMAFRLNLFSALWAALTLALLFALARQFGLRRVAALGGTLAFALAPAFWRYAGLAAVYSLHTALLVAALNCWVRWSTVSAPSDAKWFWAAAFFTGLALTNHPTAAFLVPAAVVFVVLHWIPDGLLPRHSSPGRGKGQETGLGKRPRLRELLVAVVFFVLPGLIYLYVPLSLWASGACVPGADLAESIAKGRMPPYVDCALESFVDYVTGRSLLVSYNVQWDLLWSSLPKMLIDHFGRALAVLGVVGSVVWLVRRPRSWVLPVVLLLPAAAYAVTYDADFAARDEIAHLEGHLLPALLVFSLWIGQGLNSIMEVLMGLFGHSWLANSAAALLLILALSAHLWRSGLPTARNQVQSLAIQRYWTEVLSYPLEPGAALTGHWGDLTSFWYFQHGEGQRPDLWGIYPPSMSKIDAWLAETDRALYLAGPVLDWNPHLLAQYNLTPWGILVRISPWDDPPDLPPMASRTGLFGDSLQLEGYTTYVPGEGESERAQRRQLWLVWHTIAPTPRDLSVSMRLHAPDGRLLLQQDGRLASLWFPEGTMQAGQRLLTVFDIEPPDSLPQDAVVRITVYDPHTLQPLLTSEGQDLLELGPLTPPSTLLSIPPPLVSQTEMSYGVYVPLVGAGQ